MCELQPVIWSWSVCWQIIGVCDVTDNVSRFSVLGDVDKCIFLYLRVSTRWFMRWSSWRHGDDPSASDPSPSCSVLRRCLRSSQRFSFATSQCALGRKLTVLRYCASISRRRLGRRPTSEDSNTAQTGRQTGGRGCRPARQKLVVSVGWCVRGVSNAGVWHQPSALAPRYRRWWDQFLSCEKLQFLSL